MGGNRLSRCDVTALFTEGSAQELTGRDSDSASEDVASEDGVEVVPLPDPLGLLGRLSGGRVRGLSMTESLEQVRTHLGLG